MATNGELIAYFKWQNKEIIDNYKKADNDLKAELKKYIDEEKAELTAQIQELRDEMSVMHTRMDTVEKAQRNKDHEKEILVSDPDLNWNLKTMPEEQVVSEALNYINTMMRKNLTTQFTIFLTFLSEIRAFTISQIYGEELIESWNVYVSGPL